MPFGQLLLLGAIAGLTIFLGLPLATLRTLKPGVKAGMNGIATGILLFLAIEIVSKVFEIGEGSVHSILTGKLSTAGGIGMLVLVIAGIAVGLLGIPFIEKRVVQPAMRRSTAIRAEQDSVESPEVPGSQAGNTAVATVNARSISLSIAAGIGLHNFGEGLAIGQSASSGAVSLALVLIIGFGLHNMTEGFGVAAPLTGTRPSARFIAGAGLIAGGPTFVGTLVGSIWQSLLATAIFLSIAGGSLIYVTLELAVLGRKSLKKTTLLATVAGGLFIGYVTEMIVALATGT
jgi:ZIP family zinc transporter